jgi:hypothetical protein
MELQVWVVHSGLMIRLEKLSPSTRLDTLMQQLATQSGVPTNQQILFTTQGIHLGSVQHKNRHPVLIQDIKELTQQKPSQVYLFTREKQKYQKPSREEYSKKLSDEVKELPRSAVVNSRQWDSCQLEKGKNIIECYRTLELLMQQSSFYFSASQERLKRCHRLLEEMSYHSEALQAAMLHVQHHCSVFDASLRRFKSKVSFTFMINFSSSESVCVMLVMYPLNNAD